MFLNSCGCHSGTSLAVIATTGSENRAPQIHLFSSCSLCRRPKTGGYITIILTHGQTHQTGLFHTPNWLVLYLTWGYITIYSNIINPNGSLPSGLGAIDQTSLESPAAMARRLGDCPEIAMFDDTRGCLFFFEAILPGSYLFELPTGKVHWWGEANPKPKILW